VQTLRKEASVRRLIGITLLGLFAVAVTLYGQPPAARNSLVGAWRVTEIDDVNRPPITNPQPGLYIFTQQHYSFARINGEASLPSYPSNDKATDADKVAVFNMLYLNSGTYTVTANMLTTKATMAKSAFAIGASNQYEFVVNGKALVLTQKPSGAVIKLIRVE
jgi:Lipocalin-like domain